MEHLLENSRLVKRAYWLIRLRWIAAVCVLAVTYFCSNVLEIGLCSVALYSIAILLAFYNLIVLLLLNRCSGANGNGPCAAVKKMLHFQICADLVILTALLHFSGGIENPFVFFFIFHMIIASILLSLRESYLQATFAFFLFGLLVILEYLQIIPHHCLRGFVAQCLHRDGPYVLGTFFVFAVTLYLVVYMASYIAVRLRGAEQAYRQANALLHEKDRIKDEYVLRVTHDIKGHLATIQTCLAVVSNETVGQLNGRQADFVNRAHNRAKKVLTFVKTLLKLTKMRLSGELEMGIFSLEKTVHNAVAAVKARADEKWITLNCNIEQRIDEIVGNQFSIEEVVANLLLNAIKYTPENGVVTVDVKNREHLVLIGIADTGIGIPADEIDRVFDECFRASNARKVEPDGTGLGLSIAKYIVERHGGQIRVDSKEGCGTKFALTLPKGGDNHGKEAKVRVS